jgi:hypothetical protein
MMRNAYLADPLLLDRHNCQPQWNESMEIDIGTSILRIYCCWAEPLSAAAKQANGN